MCDTCNHPSKFRNDHRTLVLMGGCVWGHYRACWPRPSPFTTILCNFHQFWLVWRFLWVLKYVKALRKCDKWGRIKIIYKNNRFCWPLHLYAWALIMICDTQYVKCILTSSWTNKLILAKGMSTATNTTSKQNSHVLFLQFTLHISCFFATTKTATTNYFLTHIFGVCVHLHL